VLWQGGTSLTYSNLNTANGYQVPGTTTDGTELRITAYYPGEGNWGYFENRLQGLLVQKTVQALVSASGDLSYSNWQPAGVIISNTFTKYDGTDGFNIATYYDGGTIATSDLPYGTDCVVFTFRPTTSENVAINRGSNWVIYSVDNKTITTTNAITQYGSYEIGDGFIVLWAVMPGTKVIICPGGPLGSGALDWMDLQVMSGALAPAPLSSTPASADASSLYEGAYTDVISVNVMLKNQTVADLESVDTTPLAFSDFGAINDIIIASIDLGSFGTIFESIASSPISDLGNLTFYNNVNMDILVIPSTGILALGNVVDSVTTITVVGSVADGTDLIQSLGSVVEIVDGDFSSKT
jgi:hypothetical protein